MNQLTTSDLSDLGMPIHLARPIRLNSGKVADERKVRPIIVSKTLNEEFAKITGRVAEEFALPARIFALDLQENDDVLVRAAENNLPLVVRRDEEVIVNFDIRAMQAFEWIDSKRPIYTYIPGFNIQTIPPVVRRPLSNLLQAGNSSGSNDVMDKYRRLPLTSFEFVVLLLNLIATQNSEEKTLSFHWPEGKRAIFVPFHDVDTGGFLRRGDCDPLFLVERKHKIRSTWFITTTFLEGDKKKIDFLLRSGNEVGWHDHNHDHRLPFSPFAEQRVQMLKNSWLCEPENYPAGMRTPKLLKSNHLFDVLDRSCSNLRYDTSFLQGIVPYYLWVNGRKTNILEIPITVPTDIVVWNALSGSDPSRRAAAILETQIERTKKLIEVGGIISIVTHPEKDLSEQPELLDVYDQYLSYIESCPEIGIMTGGELFKYWSKNPVPSVSLVPS
jgi:peptidoglycan/xylan/chitin deacetylase (PgdA/CDA1 family)